MNYDITFCGGDGCARRDSCHRYRQLLVYRADKRKNKKTYISMLLPSHADNCSLYWAEADDVIVNAG